MRYLIISIFCLLLFSCVTTERQNRLSQFHGKHIDELVNVIGFPDATISVGDFIVYTWEKGEVSTQSNIFGGFDYDVAKCTTRVSVNSQNIIQRVELSSSGGAIRT